MGVTTQDIPFELDQISQLVSFFEFVKNPDKYLTLISDSQKVITQMRELVGPYDTVVAAQKFALEAERVASENQAKLKAWEAELGITSQSLVSQRASDIKALADAQAIFDQKVAELEEKKKLVQADSERLSADIIRVGQKEADLDKQKEDLIVQKAELDSKVEKLQILFQG